MSSAFRQKSFHMVRRKDLIRMKVEDHRWIYGPNDILRMQGRFGLLAEMGGVQGLAAAFRSDIKTGLFDDEVKEGKFTSRQAIFGINEYPKPPLQSFLEHCKDALGDPMLIILLIAGVVAIIVGCIDDPENGWHDGLAVLIAVFIVVMVGASNNYKQERAFRALDATKKKSRYVCIRDGQPVQVDQEGLNVGDLVQLSAGANIPADGIMVSLDQVKVNESSMTGESKDITKHFEDPFLQAQTEVREGQCVMMVCSVGVHTAYGRIMDSLAKAEEATPLQEQLEKLATQIGYLGLAVSIAVFLANVIRFGIEKSDDSSSRSWDELVDFFIVSITVIVVAIPEGLPLAVTISLAYSMAKMRADQNLVKVLSACETMGNCTTICSDKTGTLTQNKMSVVEAWIAGKYYSTTPMLNELPQAVQTEVLLASVVNSKTFVLQNEMDFSKDPSLWPWKEGNQTEVGICAWVSKAKIDIIKVRDQYEVEKSFPFDSSKKRSSIIVKSPTGYRRYYKGAAEVLTNMCVRSLDSEGRPKPFDEATKADVMGRLEHLTATGLRSIALAYIDLERVEFDESKQMIEPVEVEKLCLVGIVGIKDPLRPESKRAVRELQRAGIVVRMCTGDHLDTAKFIARECGILTSREHHIAMNGPDFRRMIQANVDSELRRVIPRLRVLARSQPDDKEALVKWLKANGNVVSVTGDGTNDAPALRAADVGLAMGITGTDVAKAAAHIQILDDNFASIVESVKWGRSVFDNIRKFVQFQLTVNVVALIITFIGAVSGEGVPLNAVQLLWVNLIMDTMGALALGTEMPTRELLKRKPYKRNSGLISPAMWRNILVQCVLQITVMMLILYKGNDWFLRLEDDDPRHNYHGEEKDNPITIENHTMVFNAFVFMQVFNEINSRKVGRELNVFKGFFDNFMFTVIIIITAGLQVILIELGGSFMGTTGLSTWEWGWSIIFGLFAIPIGLLGRLIIPVNYSWGEIDITPETFDGAQLDKPDDQVQFNLRDDGGSNGSNGSSTASSRDKYKQIEMTDLKQPLR